MLGGDFAVLSMGGAGDDEGVCLGLELYSFCWSLMEVCAAFMAVSFSSEDLEGCAHTV